VGRKTALSVSATGTIAYRSGTGGQRQFTWFDRSGNAMETVGSPDNLNVRSGALSRDGRYVAMSRTVGGNFDIWLLDVMRGVLSRVTSAPTTEAEPFWSPSGSHLVFRSSRSNRNDVYVKAVNSPPGSEQLLASTPAVDVVSDWSRNFVIFDSGEPYAQRDIWAVPVDANGKPGEPFAVVQSEHDEIEGRLSPDGKWIAYESNDSGRGEVYIQGFRNPGRRTQVSRAGGGQIQWRRDGQELFYLAHDGKLMAASIRTTPSGDIEASVPNPLFQTRMLGAGHPRQYERVQYSASADGKRFLMNTETEVPASSIHIIMNWKGRP
jgi:Tol biopolymer transport system component